MKSVLYERRDAQIWCTITAVLVNGKLSVNGHDLGPKVEEFFGRDEYEYALSLDEENTSKLFRTLNCSEKSDEEKMQVIKDKFGNSYADTALKSYCWNNGIKTSFWCWP